MNRFVRPIESHPIPFDQDEINEIWYSRTTPPDGGPPTVDEAHEEYKWTIAEWGDWRVFRVHYPFGTGGYVTFWNRSSGEAFQIRDEEGSWHELVNLFAEIVDVEEDCRDADYSDSLMPSGGYEQCCEECGSTWSVGMMSDGNDGELKTAHRKSSLREWLKDRFGYYFKVKRRYRWRYVDQDGEKLRSSPKTPKPQDVDINGWFRQGDKSYIVRWETRRIMWGKTIKESLSRRQLNIWVWQEIHVESVGEEG